MPPNTNLPAVVVVAAGGPSAEVRTVRQACLMEDIPVLAHRGVNQHFRHGVAMPVGSVEFVRSVMHDRGLDEPASISYPAALAAFYGRSIWKTRLDDARAVPGPVFVKPVETKRFTGFVYTRDMPATEYDEHDGAQLLAMHSLPPGTQVWCAEPVKFVSEWRYYVLAGEVIGAARYDPDGADDAPGPSKAVLDLAIVQMSAARAPTAYGIDLGVLSDGRTSIVEVNDAWALGRYGNSVSPRDYLRLLWARWREITLTA
jgi:hypothetical protein